MYNRRRVRLVMDLTQYDPRCVAGIEGWTDEKNDPRDKGGAFAKIQFDNGAYLDVPRISLKKIVTKAITECAHCNKGFEHSLAVRPKYCSMDCRDASRPAFWASARGQNLKKELSQRGKEDMRRRREMVEERPELAAVFKQYHIVFPRPRKSS
jgi:hypothetical protein